MRSVVADPKSIHYMEATRGPNGEDWGTYQGDDSYVPHSWTRSDIVKVPYVDSFRAPTPYKSTKRIERPLKVSASRPAFDGAKYVWEDEITAQHWRLPGIPGSDPSLQSALVMKALASVKDEKINVAVALAEMGDTIKMIAKHSVKIRQAFSAARRGNWKRAYDILGIGRNYKQGRRDLASGWLEIIYGWLPTLGDIYGAVDELNRKVQQEGYTIVGRARSQYDVSATAIVPRFYRWGFCSAQITTQVATSVTQKVSLWYRLDMPGLQRAAAIGVLNPFTIAWELTPFSFLVDWFSSIGDWLASIDATVGLSYMGGTHTWRAFQEISGQQCVEYSGGDLQYTEGFFSSDSMVRSVISDSPDDALVFSNPLSTSHAITAVALTITTLKTR